MATGNDVTARVRITIDGVEASKKNLQSLEEASKSLSEKLGNLKLKQVELTNEFSKTGSAETGKQLAEVVKQVNQLSTALKTNKQLITTLRENIDSYDNVLENLAGATLQKLNQASRNLAAQMKTQVTPADIEKWHALAQAQKEVQEQIQQLNGKAPNLGYVMQNLGTVSNKSLQDSRKYLNELIADTEQGTERMARLRQQLDQVNAEAQGRFQTQAEQAIWQAPYAGASKDITTQQARENISTLQSYRDTLNLQTQVDEIKRVEEAIEAYERALGQMQQKTVDVGRVLADPELFSTEQIRQAIAELEKQMNQTAVGDVDTIKALQKQIDALKSTLAATADQQQETFISRVAEGAKNGTANIADMEKAVKMLQEKLRRTPKSETGTIETLRKQLDEINPKLANTRSAIANVKEVLKDVKAASINNLREAAQALNEELKHISGNSKEFAETAKQLKEVKQRMEELTEEASSAESQFDKAVSRLKNWVLIYKGFSVSTEKLQQAVADNIKLTDSMTDVQKVSGMTADEVARLTDKIWELDTRVANSTLLEAAVTGGKLGLKGIDEVYEYTKASSVALTALDELNSESIQTVMKVNDLLGETSKLGIEQAILSTASAVNELSINTAASQMPIIDFTRRFGGIAAQAHLATADVLALGATVDALGQPMEVASTALNKFTTALVTNTKQIAADVGISEEYAQTLINQGRTMDFMFDVLGKLGQMGGLQNIAQYMGDMGSDGARMVSVIAALSSNVQALHENVELSNDSFEEGTSVLNEYNLKNENAQALTERMANDINEMLVNSKTAKALEWLVGGLQTFVHWLREGGTVMKVFTHVFQFLIVFLTSSRLTWTNLVDGLKKLGTGFKSLISLTNIVGISFQGLKAKFTELRVQAAATGASLASLSAGFKTLGIAIKGLLASNPLGWLTLAVGMVWDLWTSTSKTTEAQEEQNSVIDQANAKIEDELYELNKLVDKNTELERATLSDNEAKKQRIELIGQMNRSYSQYIGFLLNESASYQEIATAADLATAAIKRKHYEEGRVQAETDVNKKYQNQILQGSRELKNYVNQLAVEFALTENQAKDLFKAMQKDLRKYVKEEGKAMFGENVREVLGRLGNKTATRVTSYTSGSLSSGAKGAGVTSTVSLNMNTLLKDVNNRKLQQYFGALVQREKEKADIIEGTNLLLSETMEEQREGYARMEAIYLEKIKGFDPATASQTDMLNLSNLISLTKQNSKMYAEGSLAQKELLENVKEYEAMQLEVIKKKIDAPLVERNYSVDKYGNVVWGEGTHIVKDIMKAMPQTINSEINRYNAEMKSLLDRTDASTNLIVRDYAKKMADRLRMLKDVLKKMGWKQDSKGGLELDLSADKKGRGSGSSRNAANDSYQAMLNTINAFFDKLDGTIKAGYLKAEMTEEQYTIELARNRKRRAQVLQLAQAELLDPEKGTFDEEKYLTIEGDEEASKKALANFKKLIGYVAMNTNNLSERVRKDFTANLNAAANELIKQKQKIDQILLDGQVFTKLSRQYQEQLEGLDLFAHLERSTHIEAQDYADKLMKTMADAIASGKVQSAEALRDALFADQTFGEEWKRMNESWAENAENNWLVIYQIVSKYSQNIASTAEQLFQNNLTRIRKFIESTEAYKKLLSEADQIKLTKEDVEKRFSGEKEYTDFLAGAGALTQGQKYKRQMDTLSRELAEKNKPYLQSLDNETQQYELKRQTTAGQFDMRIQAAKGDAELRIELERQKNQALEDLQREHADTVHKIETEQAQETKEIQDEILHAYIDNWNTQFEKYREYADAVGELAGTLASAEWNSAEDRKAAAKSFLQTISKLLIQELQERLKALIMKQTIDKAELASQQMLAAQKEATDKTQSINSVTLAGREAVTEIGISGAQGAAKEVGSKGLAGLATAAIVMAATAALSALVNSIISSAFPEASTTDTKTTSKPIAPGMLTYAEGRYPVVGADGRRYEARYEPELQTGIYQGGNGKAHMALFSEQMPEMVISGPTTKIIQEDYPQLLEAILTIDKHKRRKQALPVYAEGNVAQLVTTRKETGLPADNAEAEAREQALVNLVKRMGDSIDTLNSRLVNLRATINMYGDDGLKENLRKADEFYKKNKK